MTVGSINQPATDTVNRPNNNIAIYLLAIALLMFIVSLSVSPNPGVDLFWQLRTGRNILSLHAFPFHDVHSWSRYGHAWIVHEWGTCVLLWEMYRIGGYAGVWLLQIAILSIVYLIVYLILLKETGGVALTSVYLAIIAAKLTNPLMSPRPHLFTYLFLTIIIGIILSVRRDPKRIRFMWLIIPICILWANFHAGVVAGIGLLLVFGLCDYLQARYEIKQSAFLPNTNEEEIGTGSFRMTMAKMELIVALCSVAAIIINPYGWRIYGIFMSTVSDPTMPSFVSEWAALNLHTPYGLLTEGLCFVLIAGIAASTNRKNVSDIVMIALLAHTAFAANRNVPLFAIVSVLLAAKYIQSALYRIIGNTVFFGPNPPVFVACAVGAAIMLQSYCFAIPILRKAPKMSDHPITQVASVALGIDTFPADACRFIRKEAFPPDIKLYNDYNLGSYIHWMLPEYRVFISTQTDVFFGKVLQDYAELDKQPFGWRKIVGKYHPDVVFTSTSEQQARLFGSSPEWTLCYADRPNLDDYSHVNSLIFVRNEPRFAGLIARCHRDCATLKNHPELLQKPLEMPNRN